MGKKVKKALNVATFGATGLMEKTTKSAFDAVSNIVNPQAATTNDMTGSIAAPDAIPTALDPDVQAAREAQKKRQQAYAGLSANVLTRPGGLTGGANTQMKTLLGS